MARATAAQPGTDEASRELYRACGFTPWYRIDDYEKTIQPQREAAACVPVSA